ncbi:MAG: IS1 family transposase [Ruminococcus sp.]|nr:IS1 family transposase [Ruminococcus sp.]
MKKCPQCGSTNLTEIAPNNGRRQWLCSDCGKVSRSKNPDTTLPNGTNKGVWINKFTDEPEQTKPKPEESDEEQSARESCALFSKIWAIVGIILAVVLVFSGMVNAAKTDDSLSLVLFIVSGGLILLICLTVSVILKYLAVKK